MTRDDQSLDKRQSENTVESKETSVKQTQDTEEGESSDQEVESGQKEASSPGSSSSIDGFKKRFCKSGGILKKHKKKIVAGFGVVFTFLTSLLIFQPNYPDPLRFRILQLRLPPLSTADGGGGIDPELLHTIESITVQGGERLTIQSCTGESRQIHHLISSSLKADKRSPDDTKKSDAPIPMSLNNFLMIPHENQSLSIILNADENPPSIIIFGEFHKLITKMKKTSSAMVSFKTNTLREQFDGNELSSGLCHATWSKPKFVKVTLSKNELADKLTDSLFLKQLVTPQKLIGLLGEPLDFYPSYLTRCRASKDKTVRGAIDIERLKSIQFGDAIEPQWGDSPDRKFFSTWGICVPGLRSDKFRRVPCKTVTPLCEFDIQGFIAPFTRFFQ